jgi:hypothetical protein
MMDSSTRANAINLPVIDAAEVNGWSVALDAVSKAPILLLIAAVVGAEPRPAGSRMYEEAGRFDHVTVQLAALASKAAPEHRGHA